MPPAGDGYANGSTVAIRRAGTEVPMSDETEGPAIAAEPDDYLQGEAATLIEVIDAFAGDGYDGQFAETDAKVRCLACDVVSPPATVELHELRRLEGASDPSDMLAVAAITCPSCGARGTLVLNYGPEATAGDGEVLAGLG
jgi:hypothetical protein